MIFRVVSLFFLVCAVALMPAWGYSRPWPPEANLPIIAFCLFVAALTFLVSVMARRGSTLWKGRGHG